MIEYLVGSVLHPTGLKSFIYSPPEARGGGISQRTHLVGRALLGCYTASQRLHREPDHHGEAWLGPTSSPSHSTALLQPPLFQHVFLGQLFAFGRAKQLHLQQAASRPPAARFGGPAGEHSYAFTQSASLYPWGDDMFSEGASDPWLMKQIVPGTISWILAALLLHILKQTQIFTLTEHRVCKLRTILACRRWWCYYYVPRWAFPKSPQYTRVP